jgi:hypothetical protein
MLPHHEDVARVLAARRRTEAEWMARERGHARDRGHAHEAHGAGAEGSAPATTTPHTDQGCRPCPPPHAGTARGAARP